MAKGSDVLGFLIPQGGWVITGDDFENIQFIDCKPITKKQFEDGFAQYDTWKAQQDLSNATAKAALLAQLGITEEQAKLLLS
jgi:hypothetical protein